jgi:hypothetical protein
MRKAFALLLSACAIAVLPAHAAGAQTWEDLDKRLKQQVYEINVGLKLKSNDGLCIYVSDLAPAKGYPVFTATPVDHGYRVAGFGSAFPVKTRNHDKTYFLTSAHLADSGDKLTKECQRFYAGMRLFAEQTGNGNPDARYKQLIEIANLSTKKGLSGKELEMYQVSRCSR